MNLLWKFFIKLNRHIDGRKQELFFLSPPIFKLRFCHLTLAGKHLNRPVVDPENVSGLWYPPSCCSHSSLCGYFRCHRQLLFIRVLHFLNPRDTLSPHVSPVHTDWCIATAYAHTVAQEVLLPVFIPLIKNNATQKYTDEFCVKFFKKLSEHSDGVRRAVLDEPQSRFGSPPPNSKLAVAALADGKLGHTAEATRNGWVEQ